MPALATVVTSFVAGALLGGLLGGPPAWSVAVVGVALTAASMRIRPGISMFVVVAAVAFAGAGHAYAIDSRSSPDWLPAYDGTREVTGIVRHPPVIRGSLLRASIDVEQVDGRHADGRVTVLVPAAREVSAGDRLSLVGDIEPVEDAPAATTGGVIAFPDRWAVIGHEPPNRVVRALHAVRERAVSSIERVLPEPESSLSVGVLLGVQQTMPDDLARDLRATGTTHLVVVSGQNVALVLGIAVAALSARLSRRHAAGVALGILPAYVALVGAEPPVVRAAIMAIGITLVDMLGRRTPGWIFLVYAVGVMLASEPALARSLSFQLSVAATGGVLLVAPPIRDTLLSRCGLTSSGAVASIIEVTAVSTGAALAVAPVQAAAFGVLPLLQIPANVLVAPLYEATLAAAALAALLGSFPPLEEPARVLLAPAPAAFLAAIRFLAVSPAVMHVPPFHGPLIVGAYAALAVVVAFLARARTVTLAPSGGTGLALTLLLASAAAGLWSTVLAPSNEPASVTVLDVGQGLAVLIRDRGNAVLVDTGPPDGSVMAALGRAGQYDALDAVILTHEDIDHSGGIEAVRRRVGARELLGAAGSVQQADAGTIDIGDRIHVSDRTTIEVISPPVRTAPALSSDNDRSLVLLLTVGDRRILLPADIESDGEQWLVRSGLDLRADALVVPHHGSATSSGPDFVAAVDPAVAIISVGASNPFGHPSATVLARYLSAAVLRTDEDGDITLTSDGTTLWFRSSGG
ncbi:MAG: DNA internalization-related competence protein ComEC/Rec2 [Dehalococcoidia bacterium]